jgi:hypothetical protein
MFIAYVDLTNIGTIENTINKIIHTTNCVLFQSFIIRENAEYFLRSGAFAVFEDEFLRLVILILQIDPEVGIEEQ